MLLVLAMAMVACGGDDENSADQGDPGREALVVAINRDPENLSPLFLDINTGNWKIFSGLVQYDSDLNLVPDLALEMPTFSGEGRTVTVRLRSDVTFHDGESFTATDVVFTWEALLDPTLASPLSLRWDLPGSVESVKAVDDSTVVFRLKRVDPAFLEKLYVGIVPEHVLAGQDLATTDFNRNPVGTGPYQMGDRRPGERMVLEAYADYYDSEAPIKRVVYTFIPDENARAASLGEGSIDVARLPPRLASGFEDDNRYRVVEIPSAAVDQVALPTANPVVSDPRVRRAIAYAFDRETAAAAIYAGRGTAAHTPFAASSWAFDGSLTTDYDPEKAAELLDEAGWVTGDDGFRTRDGTRLGFTVMVLPNITTHRELALALRSDLAEVGIDLAVEAVESSLYRDRLGTDAWLHGLGNPYDPDAILYGTYHSSFARDADPGTNPAALENPAVDAALEAGRATTSRERRTEAYRDLQEALLEDGAYLYMGVGNHAIVVPSAVRGIEVQAQGGAHNFPRGISWNLERWFFVER